jgi:putative membrane protein
MKRALLLAGACALLAAPAFAQSPPSQNPPPQGNAQQEAQPKPAPAAPSTADFVKNAAMAGMFEIRSSKLALKKHVSADRHFALHMIRDHRKIDTELKHLVQSGDVQAELPKKLDSQHQEMLAQLRKESGANFDKDYDQMQLKGHQEAVSLFQSYAQNGDNPKLKRWAADTLPKLQDHLAMAEKLSQQ